MLYKYPNSNPELSLCPQEPTSYWEGFFLAASAGDIKGLWALNTPNIIKVSAPVALGGLVWKLATGNGLPLHLGEVSFVILLSGVITEVVYALLVLGG
jgi:hypothetical protein